MANLSVVNIVPPPGTVTGVLTPTRFGIRDDSLEVVKTDINVYWGSGPAFWQGGVLPEDYEEIQFLLTALSANPVGVATRTLEPGGEMKLVKAGATSQKGVYQFGGLQAPAASDDPLMVEFKLKLAQADVTADGAGFTGVVVVLKTNDTGLSIKFFTNGVTRRIEIHSAVFSSTTPLATAVYDWDQSIPHTYKLLWHPRRDLVKLYASTGPVSMVSDLLLATTTVSAFPGPLPINEIPDHQPVVYFGHAYPVPQSTSYWYETFLFNLVSSPIVNGLFQGGHVGFIRSDEITTYPADTLPSDAEQAWLDLPSTYAPVEGVEYVDVVPRLRLSKGPTSGSSIGHVRYDPRIATGVTTLDFRLSGQVMRGDPNSVTTGMEFFITDGIYIARVALLDFAGSQAIGLLTGSLETWAGSYDYQFQNWLNEYTYRLRFDPTGQTKLYQLVGFEEVEVKPLASFGTIALPASPLTSPCLGFMINGQVSTASVEMIIGRVRYSTLTQEWVTTIPTTPWVEDPLPSGTGGVVSLDPDEPGIIINNDVPGEHLYFKNAIADFDSTDGFFLEFRASVDSYSVEGIEDPIREVTGVGISLDDASYQATLLFAEMGPDLGRIIFIATDTDYVENLIKIRSGDASVEGTYTNIDWTANRLYRLEKSVGGTLRLYIDDEDEPRLELDLQSFTFPATVSSSPEIRFGSLMTDRLSQSRWQQILYGVSNGFDVSCYPNLDEDEALQRFNHANNIIVEA